MPWPDDGMEAMLYNIRSIDSVPHIPGGSATWAPRPQNILSAVKFNPTGKSKLESYSPMMACGLCCITLEVFTVGPMGRVVLSNGL
jgi:hypothetical protein